LLFLDVAGRKKTSREPIGGGAVVPARFYAKWDWDGVGIVDLTIETSEGKPRISEARISETEPGGGVTGIVLAGTPVRDLLTDAVEAVAWISSGISAQETRDAAATSVRRRPNAGRLQEVADAYLKDGIAGIEELLGVGERHAFRLKKAAIDAGLLSESDSAEEGD
jgi:hypothetical protein